MLAASASSRLGRQQKTAGAVEDLRGHERVGRSLSSAFALVMIGVLINIVAPASVGGDVVKAHYVARGVGYGIVRLR